METISDILKEMRERFKPYERSESNDARYTAYMGYAEFADRIEAAHKRGVADALDTGAFVEATRKRKMKSIKNDECYVVEAWDFYFNQWFVFASFLDCADAEKEVSFRLECNKRHRTKSKYRIIKKTSKHEVVYEIGND